ncbi:hypothetical protein ACFSTC_19185 [Nonomuraea ferruginea]
MTDVPYGEQTHWRGPSAAAGVSGMVEALSAVLPHDSVIAVTVRGRKVPMDRGPRPQASFKNRYPSRRAVPNLLTSSQFRTCVTAGGRHTFVVRSLPAGVGDANGSRLRRRPHPRQQHALGA